MKSFLRILCKILTVVYRIFLIVILLNFVWMALTSVLNSITNKRMHEEGAIFGCLMCVYNVIGEVRDKAFCDVWEKGATHGDGVIAAVRLGCCVVHSIERMHPSFCDENIHAVFLYDANSWSIVDPSGRPLEVMWCDDVQSDRLSDRVKNCRFGNLYVWSRGRNGKNEYGYGDDICIRPVKPYDF